MKKLVLTFALSAAAVAGAAVSPVQTPWKAGDNGIKIYYTVITAIPQQILNEQCFELGIGGARSFNELNRTHWALKQINLIEALQKAGVQII